MPERLAGRDEVEQVGLDDVHARVDEVGAERLLLDAPQLVAVAPPLEHAVEHLGVVLDAAHRDARVLVDVVVEQVGEVDVGDEVAVGDDDRAGDLVARQQAERTGGAERLLLVDVADPQPEPRAVADRRPRTPAAR